MKNNPRTIAILALQKLYNQNAYSHILWDAELEKNKLREDDKKLATRIFYGTISYRYTLEWLWNHYAPDYTNKADPLMKITLQTALYQLRYLEKIPPYSILNESVEFIKQNIGKKAAPFCNALLRKILPHAKDKLPILTNPIENLSLQHSLPHNIAKILIEQYQTEQAHKCAEAFNNPAPIKIRTNTSKISATELAQKLNAQPDPHTSAGLILNTWSQNLKNALDNNLCHIQDSASQSVVLSLNDLSQLPQNKQNTISIWDACAGQGGKTLQLLDLISQKNTPTQLLATDLYPSKLQRLKDLKNKAFPQQKLSTKALDLTILNSVQNAPFSAILIDAPCSGLGIIQKHPDTKWNNALDNLDELIEIQAKILKNAAKHLMKSGILIYSVCTFTKQETTDQIHRFLNENPDFKPAALNLPHLTNQSHIQFLPHIHNTDGFFIAKFIKS